MANFFALFVNADVPHWRVWGFTSGGIKVLRFLLLKRQGERELKRLIHPNGVFSLYLGQEPLSDKIIQGIWGFVAIFFVLFILIILRTISHWFGF